MASKLEQIVLGWLMAGLVLLATGRAVAAHTSDIFLRVDRAAAGRCEVTIWTAPSVLRTGEIHVISQVTDFSGTPLPGTLVQVTATPFDGLPGSQTVLAGPADPNNQLRREAALWLTTPGRYRFTVTVVEPDGTNGMVNFVADVVQVPPLVKGFLLFQLGLTGLAGLWFAWTGYRIWFKTVAVQAPNREPARNNNTNRRRKEHVRRIFTPAFLWGRAALVTEPAAVYPSSLDLHGHRLRPLGGAFGTDLPDLCNGLDACQSRRVLGLPFSNHQFIRSAALHL